MGFENCTRDLKMVTESSGAGYQRSELLSADSLSPTTRSERKGLLVAALITITVVRAELLPTKISMLGIEFSASNHKSLLAILALVIAYFLLEFAVHAYSDFVRHVLILARLAKVSRHEVEQLFAESKKLSEADQKKLRGLLSEERAKKSTEPRAVWFKAAFSIRTFVDIVVPLGCGLFALIDAVILVSRL